MLEKDPTLLFYPDDHSVFALERKAISKKDINEERETLRLV